MAATPRTSASRGERSATSSPSSSSRPSSGASTPATIRPSVDLPAPFSPTSAWIDPRAMLSDTRVERADGSEVLGDVRELDMGSWLVA